MRHKGVAGKKESDGRSERMGDTKGRERRRGLIGGGERREGMWGRSEESRKRKIYWWLLTLNVTSTM